MSGSDSGLTLEGSGDSGSSNSSSQTLEGTASSSESNSSFLKFLQQQNDPQNQTLEAGKWRKERKEGGSFFNYLPTPPFIKEHTKRLFALFSTHKSGDFIGKFHEWMLETLPLFNDLFDNEGDLKQDFLDLDSTKTQPLIEHSDEVFNLFQIMINQAITEHVENENLTQRVLILRFRDDEGERYDIVKLHDFFNRHCATKISLQIVNKQNTDEQSQTQYTFSASELPTLVSNKPEILYDAARNAIGEVINNPKTADNEPPHIALARSILSTVSTLKEQNENLSFLADILLVSADNVGHLNANNPDPNDVLKSSTKLTELAAQLGVENPDDESKVCATAAVKGRNLKLAGLLIGLAGLAIAAVSITLAVATCGISTPLSLLGLHVGVSMIGCSVSVFTGTLALGSVGLGFFGAYRGHQKQKDAKEKLSQIEPRNQLSESLTQLADVAQQRVNPLRN